MAERLDELEELEADLLVAQEALDDADLDEDNVGLHEDIAASQAEFGKDEQEEIIEIEGIKSEVSGFRDGETMIPLEDFTNYCRELVIDTDLPRNLPSYLVIDWEATAENLENDYVEDGYT